MAVFGTAYTFIDAHGVTTKTVQPPTQDADIRRAMPWRNPICHPSVMFRRMAVLEVGGYLGGLHAEDYDLCFPIIDLYKNQLVKSSSLEQAA